jgi:nucleoside-diphosphate-sugar epimerase
MSVQPKILVTGATGLLGSHLAYQLLAQGHPVRAAIRAGSNKEMVRRIFQYYTSDAAQLFSQIEWVEGDLTDPTAVDGFLDGIERVFHCAAMVSFRPKDAEQMIAFNRKTTETLVNAALTKGLVHFCHVSSVSSLGRIKGENLIDESKIWVESSENSKYALSKYQAEMEVWRGIEEGLPAVIVNPGIILGPGFWDKGSSHFFKAIHKGFPFTSEGVNGFVDVRDVATIMMLLSEQNVVNQRFILVSENISYTALFNLIATAFGKKGPTFQPKGWMLRLFAKLENWRSVLLGTYPLVTKETARTSQQISRYQNQKILQQLPGFSFRSLRTTTQDFCRFFDNDTQGVR